MMERILSVAAFGFGAAMLIAAVGFVLKAYWKLFLLGWNVL
jgi:hypothetical protein